MMLRRKNKKGLVFSIKKEHNSKYKKVRKAYTLKNITVEYPTTEVKVLKTEAQMRELGYKNHKGDKLTYLPVNRAQSIQVRQVARLVQEEFMVDADYDAEAEAMCVAQTGMTPSAYQAKYKRAWNE